MTLYSDEIKDRRSPGGRRLARAGHQPGEALHVQRPVRDLDEAGCAGDDHLLRAVPGQRLAQRLDT